MYLKSRLGKGCAGGCAGGLCGGVVRALGGLCGGLCGKTLASSACQVKCYNLLHFTKVGARDEEMMASSLPFGVDNHGYPWTSQSTQVSD